MIERTVLCRVTAVAGFVLAAAACTTDDASESGGDSPRMDTATATMVVESVFGRRVAVDGRRIEGVPPGQQFEVAAGEHAFAVGGPGGWSAPVVAEVVPDEQNVVRVPWNKLPLGDRLRVPLGPPKSAGAPAGPSSGPSRFELVRQKVFRSMATFTAGASVSGPFVEIRSPKAPLAHRFEFEDGDRVFTVDGRPAKSIKPLRTALAAYYRGDGDPPSWTLLREGRKWRVIGTRKAQAPPDAFEPRPQKETEDSDG